MCETISIQREDWNRLEERARRLALEKSYLQLVIHLMNNLSEMLGLDQTTEAIVRVILENLGGANVVLYYRIGERVHYLDAYGERRLVGTVEDELVRRAFECREFVEESRDFADTKMATREFTKASYWALPLIVVDQLVGVLKMEGMLMAAAEARRQLQPFFNYAAVILKNEIERFVRHTETSQLAAIVQSSDDAIIGKTLDGVITSWNQGAERMYGYTEREMAGQSIAILATPDRANEIVLILARLAGGRQVERFETLRRRKDGRVIHVALTVSPIRDAAGNVVGASTIARDITESKRAEDSLRRLNRELRSISICNQTLLRAADEQGLLDEICRTVCGEAGYRMAWVGYAERDERKSIRPVACAGSGADHLASGQATWADTEEGRSPAGRAIRVGRSVCVQDFASDPQAARWWEAAERQGFRSGIALPLKDDRAVTFGALSIFSEEPHAFTNDEVRLLEELAGNLAFGITNLRAQTTRRRAEEMLHRQTRLNNALFEQAISCFAIFDRNWRCVRVNGAFAKRHEQPKEIAGQYYQGLVPEGDASRMPSLNRDLFELKKPVFLNEVLDGSSDDPERGNSYSDIILQPLLDETGEVEFIFYSSIDITERKRVEEALNRREQEYRSLLDSVPVFIVRYDRDLRRTYVNSAWEKASGLSASEVIGVSATEVSRVPLPAVAEYVEKLRCVFETGAPQSVEFESANARGERLYLAYTIVPEYSRSGVIASVLAVGHDLTARKQVERERQAHLRLLKSMDRINRAIQATEDLDQLMRNALEATLSIFESDRVWLICPCDPAAATFQVSMECGRPEYVRGGDPGSGLPVGPETAEMFLSLLSVDAPVKCCSPAGQRVPPDLEARPTAQSQMAMALYPKTEHPYAFGLRQCSDARAWTREEERLFQEIGRRVEAALTSAIAYRVLRESERRYRLVFENSPVSLWEEDFSAVRSVFDGLRMEGVAEPDAFFAQHPQIVQQCAERVKILDVNRAALTLNGATRKDDLLAGLTWTFTPESFDVFRRELVSLWNGETEITAEATLKTLAGELKRATVHLSVCPGYEQSLGKVLVSLTDITALKEAERGLRDIHSRLTQLLRTIPDLVWLQDPDGRFLACNPPFELLVGATEAGVLGKCYHACLPPDVAEFFRAKDLEAIASDRPCVSEIWTATAAPERRVLLETIKTPMRDPHGGLIGVLSIARDITMLRRTEETVRKLSRAVEQSPVSIVITDTAGTIEYVNPKFTEVTGYPAAEALGRNPRILKSGEMEAEAYRQLWASIAVGREWRGEFHNRRKDGTLYWESASISPIRDANGDITHFLAVKEDITAHKRDQDRLREQAALLDQTQDAVLVLGLDRRFRYVNRSAESAYGLPEGQLLRQDASAIMFPHQPERCAEVCQRTLERGNWSGEVSHTTALGAQRIGFSRWTLIHDSAGRAASFLIVTTDVTEQKRLEEQFLRAQRMESIGTLASGIAHDLNNILTPIMMGTELLRPLATTPADCDVIDMLRQGAARGAGIVKQLLTFGRGARGERVLLQPLSLLKEVVKVVCETFPKNLSLVQRFPSDLWTIMADPTQIHQVLLNLCVNARDAMPRGGRLTIAAENLVVDAAYAATNPEAKAGPYLVLLVGDTGCGIPRENLRKIFDPFYTTKEVGKGTGLGLSTVMGIVKSHEGFVQVNTRVGQGTQFKVYLPAAVEAGEVRAPSSVEDLPRGKGELVMVVDDEESIRGVAQRALEENGFRVVTAEDGADAMLVFSRSKEPITAVLTDMIMPVMDGAALIRALTRYSPEVRLVAFSGMAEQEQEAIQAGLAQGAFLLKPLSLDRLIRMVHRVLHGHVGIAETSPQDGMPRERRRGKERSPGSGLEESSDSRGG